MLLYATTSYCDLRDEIADQTQGEIGQLARKTFDDGEFYHRIIDDVAGRDVVLIGGTISEPETLELFDVSCGLVSGSARSLTIVAPYLGYSTMDRAVIPGEVVKAKTRARLLSSIPHGREANRLIVLDLHAEGIQYYFDTGLHATHVYAKPIIIDAVRELGGDDFVLACTDAGRAKWVESLANELRVSASFVFKKRLDDGTPVVTAMNADVAGKRVIVYDDMVRSGNSLLNAAKAYLEAGASDVACVTTHGLFPNDALHRIKESRLISKVICTNSHPRAVELARQADGFLAVRSVAKVLADVVRRNCETSR